MIWVLIVTYVGGLNYEPLVQNYRTEKACKVVGEAVIKALNKTVVFDINKYQCIQVKDE